MNKKIENMISEMVSRFHISEEDIIIKCVTDPFSDNHCLFTIN